MQARVVSVLDIAEDDERAWRDLAARAIEPNPYLEPDALTLCARHYPEFAGARLVVAEDNGRFHAAFPIVKFQASRIPPRRVATTMGNRLRALGTPLVAGPDVDEALTTVLRGLRAAAKTQGFPGIVAMDYLHDGGAVAEGLRRACGALRMPVHTKDTWERGFLSRAGRWGSPLSKERQRALDRRRRGLARDVGSEPELVDQTHDPDAADDFLRLEAAGWKGRTGGFAFAQNPESAAWFREWYGRVAATERVSMFSIKAGDAVMATQIYLYAGEGVFCFRTAYDERYAKYGPGALILALGNERLLGEETAQWIDSATDPGGAFMLDMLPERRTLASVLVGTGAAIDRAMVVTVPALQRAAVLRGRVLSRGRGEPIDASTTR